MKPKTYITIGLLLQDLEQAYVAATRARNLAHQLVIKVGKRKNPAPLKMLAARKQKSRACSNWNRIRAELIRYKKMVDDAFTVIAYDGCIVGKYKTPKLFESLLTKPTIIIPDGAYCASLDYGKNLKRITDQQWITK